MKKKIGLSLLVLSLCATSYALGFSFRGTNMRCHYPKFSAPLVLSPTNDDIEEYLEKGQDYIDNCDRDIQKILDAKKEAIETMHDVVEGACRFHKKSVSKLFCLKKVNN